MRRLLRPWLVVLFVGLIYVGIVLVRSDGDPLAFALIGTQYGAGEAAGTEGYDGQFSYFIARDPWAGCPRCDVPAYRMQRMLYPLLAWALALGSPDWVGWTLILINLAALAGGTWATERLLARRGMSPWFALIYGFYGGLVAGLRLDLGEPLALALAQIGLWAWERERRGWAGILLALAALTKETALVACVGLLIFMMLERQYGRAIRLVAVAGLPFAVWQGVLWLWLGEPGIGSGGAMATPFEVIPFGGLWRVAAQSWPAFWLLLAIQGPLFVLPTLWALIASVRDLVRRRRHPWVGVLLAQAVVLPFLPFSTWREPLAMTRLASGLVAAVILYGGLRRSRRVLTWSLFWLATLALILNEGVLPT